MSDDIDSIDFHIIVAKRHDGHVEVFGAGCNCKRKCQEQSIWKSLDEATEGGYGARWEVIRFCIPYDPKTEFIDTARKEDCYD